MPTILIDGDPYEVREGRNVLQVALDHKLNLPYFCWHPAMGSVGACRLCAVKQYRDEDDTRGRIVMGCMTGAQEGTRVSIRDEEATRFRRSVIEWLMINHPHDCPVCDEGGECHLQDMTVMTGHAHRRYRGRKRTFRNQDLGPLIHHEMNRCITCYRCTRFYQEHAGGDDLRPLASRNRVYFGRVEEGVLESPFSGNLVEVCPTGVFTDRTYRRHYTRKWDLQTAPSVCEQCGLGCNTLPASRYGTLRRVTSRFNAEVNGYWLCDRGRFAYEHVNADERLLEPRRRPAADAPGKDGRGGHGRAEDDVPAGAGPATGEGTGGGREARGEPGLQEPVGWGEALAEAGVAVRAAAAAGTLAGVGSPRASLETNFVLQRLVGPEHFCPGLATAERDLVTGFLAAVADGGVRPASLREVGEADAVLLAGCDPTHEAPLVDMALVKVRRLGGWVGAIGIPPRRSDRLVDRLAATDVDGAVRFVTAVARRLDERARGEAADPVTARDDGDPVAVTAGRLAAADRPVLVTGTTARSPDLLDAVVRLGRALRAQRDGTPAPVLLALPEPDSLGAVLLDAGRGPGLDDLVEEIEAGRVTTLVVCENDLLARSTDPARLARALEALEGLVLVDHVESPTLAAARWVLPAATTAESTGTLVNHEGRAQRHYQVMVPRGEARASWATLRDLAAADDEIATWHHHDDVLAALAADHPRLAAAADVAPPPGFRVVHQRIPRLTPRASGRNAMPEIDDVRRHQRPPEDPESPLAFSMEGFQGQGPTPLLTRFWAPGWNSNEAINQFQIEVGGPLHGGDPGRRLLDDGAVAGALQAPPDDAPRADVDTDGRITAASPSPVAEAPPGAASPATSRRPAAAPGPAAGLRLHARAELFGSGALVRRAPALAELAPAPYLALHPDDAAALELIPGATYRLALRAGARNHEATLTVHADARLPAGHGLVPAAYPETRWWQAPLDVEIEVLEVVDEPADASTAPVGAAGETGEQDAGKGQVEP